VKNDQDLHKNKIIIIFFMKIEQVHKEQLSSLLNFTLIILDSNIFVKGHGNAKLLTILAGKLGRFKARLIVPRIVLYEVAKVTHNTQDRIIQKIKKIFRNCLTLEQTKDITQESRTLETKFYECHRPDSVVLATAKTVDAVLVTYDQKLLRTAIIEGVRAYTPREFLRHWSIEVS